MKKTPAKLSTDELSVGEVAARAGIAVSALHFYEAKGLIAGRRNNGNQRRYPRAVLRLVSLIRVAQGLGFTLKEIKNALGVVPKDRLPTKEEWARLGRSWREDLDARIETMTRLRDQLTGCIGCGCLSMKECPLQNPGDRLARKGPGQHLL